MQAMHAQPTLCHDRVFPFTPLPHHACARAFLGTSILTCCVIRVQLAEKSIGLTGTHRQIGYLFASGLASRSQTLEAGRASII